MLSLQPRQRPATALDSTRDSYSVALSKMRVVLVEGKKMIAKLFSIIFSRLHRRRLVDLTPEQRRLVLSIRRVS